MSGEGGKSLIVSRAKRLSWKVAACRARVGEGARGGIRSEMRKWRPLQGRDRHKLGLQLDRTKDEHQGNIP